MCYSAQVVQLARKLHRQPGIRLDYAEVENLLFRRLDDPTLNISRGFEVKFDDPVNETRTPNQRARLININSRD